jgi:hypothetical protein
MTGIITRGIPRMIFMIQFELLKTPSIARRFSDNHAISSVEITKLQGKDQRMPHVRQNINHVPENFHAV